MKQGSKIPKLNPKEEEFCQLYASDEEFFANGTKSYMFVYKMKNYLTAQASASRMLSNVKILKRIDEILELRGLNDSYVDKQLEFWITQKANPKTSLGAIQEYNKLRNRIKNKLEVEHAGQIVYLPARGKENGK